MSALVARHSRGKLYSPSAPACGAAPTTQLIRLGLDLVAIPPARLARARNGAPEILERAHRAPAVLSPSARLRLAALA